MKCSLAVLAIVFVVLTPGMALMANAQTFDENSADITNKYAPFSPGKSLVFAQIDKTTSKPNGKYAYWHSTGYDIVDGVKCLKLNATGWSLTTTGYIPNTLQTYWYAQSVDGSVYLLQFAEFGNTVSAGVGNIITFGKANATLYMGPAASLLADKIVTTNTGLGTFKGCFEVTTEMLGTVSFAPGIGPVKQIDKLGGISELAAYTFPSNPQTSRYDITGDDKTGLEEAIYALQVAASALVPAGVFALTSGEFAANAAIPAKFTCDDTDVSPSLAWTNPPAGTQSFVLIMDDPDAIPVVGYTWDHWIVYDIPGSATALSENAGASGGASLPAGAKQGINSFPDEQYGGPCPPSGTHRYYFKLYALDIANLNPANTNKTGIEAAMSGHVLGQTDLVGTYTATAKKR